MPVPVGQFATAAGKPGCTYPPVGVIVTGTAGQRIAPGDIQGGDNGSSWRRLPGPLISRSAARSGGLGPV
jgi:hypothetical protein